MKAVDKRQNYRVNFVQLHEVLLGLSVFAQNSTKVAAFQEFGCTQKYVNAF